MAKTVAAFAESHDSTGYGKNCSLLTEHFDNLVCLKRTFQRKKNVPCLAIHIPKSLFQADFVKTFG